jgi:lysophospholipase L1-like esterase
MKPHGNSYLSRFGARGALGLGLLILGLVAGVGAVPAVAAPAGPSTASVSARIPPAPSASSSGNGYVALGDSFTSGQGAPPYTTASGDCRVSRYAGYPVVTGLLSPYRLVANQSCAGASTAAIPTQLSGVSPATKLVTLTVGGIDAGSNQVFAACAPDLMSPACQPAIDASLGSLASLGSKLARTYAGIAQALPAAKVAVLSYPLQFEPELSDFGDQINAGTEALNAVIQAAVAGVNNPRIVFVDATQEFAGHGIGSSVPYIAFNPADLAALPNFHPNALGNSLGYYRALVNDGVLRRP